MKKITKFFLKVTSVGSILSIATLNAFQLTVVGQPTPPVRGGKPDTGSAGPRYGPPPINTPSQPDTESGGPRLIRPTKDIDEQDTESGGPRYAPPSINRPSQADTESGGPRLIQPTEDIDEPPTPRVRYVHGGCASSTQVSLTALVPKNKIARTVSDYPTFFFYLPQTDAELAEFILEDESGNQIYQQDLTIKNLSGVIGVSIPANTNLPPLEVGKSYTWVFSLVCDPEDRSGDQVERVVVRRVELSAEILRELDRADPRQKTFIYAQNGIWQEALSNLAAARRANPNDPDLAADWESLLDSVTLGEIAKEPIVEIEPQP